MRRGVKLFVDIVIIEKEWLRREDDFLRVNKLINRLNRLTKTSGICFLYNKDDFPKETPKRFSEEFENIKVFKGLIINKEELENKRLNLKTLREKLKPELIATNTSDRKVLSNKRIARNIDLIFEIENNSKNNNKDFMRYWNSGLDIVKAKLMHDNKIMLGISINQLIRQTKQTKQNKPLLIQKHKIIGRFINNIKLCRKKKVDFIIGSFAREPKELRAEKELRSFINTIGASTEQSKKAIKKLYERICFNQRINSGEIIEDGVERVNIKGE